MGHWAGLVGESKETEDSIDMSPDRPSLLTLFSNIDERYNEQVAENRTTKPLKATISREVVKIKRKAESGVKKKDKVVKGRSSKAAKVVLLGKKI